MPEEVLVEEEDAAWVVVTALILEENVNSIDTVAVTDRKHPWPYFGIRVFGSLMCEPFMSSRVCDLG